MRKIILLMSFLLISGMAFSISGKVFMHIGSYDPTSQTIDYNQTNIIIGPMFSYWGVENNVDLWQGRDGTGFEVNFDSFSIQYRTREAITVPGSLDTTQYSVNQRWPDTYAKATSPGYFRFENVKLGSAYMATGIALWSLVGTKRNFDTNGAATNNDNSGNVNFIKGYMDFKFDVPINESITFKFNDWDLMWLEFFAGSSTLKGDFASTYKTNSGNAGGFKIYCPPHLILNLDQFQLDFSPKLIFDNSLSNTIDSVFVLTNNYSDIYYRLGAVIKMTYNFDRVFALYFMAGYYNEYESLIQKINNFTNVYNLSYNANIIPLYAGLKITVTPSISLNIGYGMNLMLNNEWKNIQAGVTNIVDTATIVRTGYLNNWIANPYFTNQVSPERATYGDALTDLAFLKFGATVKIVNNWEMGMQAAVSLNDAWTREYLPNGSQNYSYTSSAGSGGNTYVYNWLSFLNWMNYDNNMYLKFETDTFIAKLTFDMWDRPASLTATIMGLFGYVDFTYKF